MAIEPRESPDGKGGCESYLAAPFRAGIVPTPNEFGANGKTAVSPAAARLAGRRIDGGNWRMKEIHRLIVTSSTYRMLSTRDEANATSILTIFTCGERLRAGWKPSWCETISSIWEATSISRWAGRKSIISWASARNDGAFICARLRKRKSSSSNSSTMPAS